MMQHVNTIENQAQYIMNELRTVGYAVHKNWLPSHTTLDEAKRRFLCISKHIGTPIAHDAHNTIIWDIKSRPTQTGGIITYSEHAHEAQLHTDSQYSLYPEDHFGLLTIRQARCGGGLSMLLNLPDILQELRSLSNGTEIEQVLRNTDFPFIIPQVFKRNIDSDEPEFNFGPILRGNEIRFRIDTFEKCLEMYPWLCSQEQILAYKALKNIVLSTPFTKKFYLEDGDLIFINNKTVLHGRTQFMDPDRHLLRIRMNNF